MRRILNSFLQFIEEDSSESIIIAATNNQGILDKALYRRFDDVLHYTMPTKREVEQLYNYKLTVYQNSFIPSFELIEKSIALSHAEIIRICNDAIKDSILDNKEITESKLLSLVDERLTVYSEKEA